MGGPCYKQNEWLISEEGEKEEKIIIKWKSRVSTVSEAKAPVVSQPIKSR